MTLLGCIAVLESAPPSKELVDHVRTLTGDGATATLARHAVSDARHADQIFALLDRLELDARLRASLGFSALHTARQAVALLGELAAPSGGPSGAPSGLSGLWGWEAALLTEIESTCGSLPDVVAHSGDIVGGLFL